MQITIPRDYLEQARAVIVNAREQWNQIDAEKAALPEIDPVKDGLNGVERRQQEINEMEQRKAAIIDIGVQDLAILRSNMDEYFSTKMGLNGNDLKDNMDYVLLTDKLISTPEELKEVASRHQDSLAFAKAVQIYAGQMGWIGFDQPVKDLYALATMARGFTNNYFSFCDVAIQNLTGLMAMQIANEEEITRMAQAHGVIGMLS